MIMMRRIVVIFVVTVHCFVFELLIEPSIAFCSGCSRHRRQLKQHLTTRRRRRRSGVFFSPIHVVSSKNSSNKRPSEPTTAFRLYETSEPLSSVVNLGVNATSSTSKTDAASTVLENVCASIDDESNSVKIPPCTNVASKRQRFVQSFPHFLTKYFCNASSSLTLHEESNELDSTILNTAIPNMINLGVVPIVNAIDTVWVGRLGVALALAGQAAANQASFTIYFLIAFLPNIVAPLVAKSVASGDIEEAQQRVCESIVLCNLLGFLGTLLLVCFPRPVLRTLVLPEGAPAMDYAAPYLRWRALGMVPSLIAATGFAAYRGLLNTITPLKVSLMTNAVNLVLDPIFIFPARMGYVGAAVATAASEALGGFTYMGLLFRRKLATWSRLLKLPSWKALLPLLQSGAAMLFRQLALNVGFLTATRRAQVMDPSGVSGAAYGIVMQMYSVGIILLVAMQGTAAVLVPASREKLGDDGARSTADRLFVWSTLVGVAAGIAQYALLPFLVPIFSPLPQVQQAAKLPALIASFVQLLNGPAFAGEGYMMGVGCYKDLALITAGATITMVACLTATPLGQRLDGIMWSILAFNLFQNVGVVAHYLKVGPLAKKKNSECVK